MVNILIFALLPLAMIKSEVSYNYNVEKVTVDITISSEKAISKLYYLSSLNHLQTPKIQKLRLIEGNRAFYNKETDEIMIPVDTPNYYLKYAVIHEQGHVVYTKKNLRGSEIIKKLKELVDVEDLKSYIKDISCESLYDYSVDDEEFFCDCVAYYMHGGKISKEAEEILNCIL